MSTANSPKRGTPILLALTLLVAVFMFGPVLLSVSEALIGLGLVGLLISFLPTMYSIYNRRELAVAQLATRAGTPPTPLLSFPVAAGTTQAAIELKVLIEQMREQIQNVE